MKKLYFVRHGESVWNTEDKICGCVDSPLTEKGHRQARETGERIRASGIRFDEILCSPLSRARDTARHISERTGVPFREEPRLTEQNFGKWEGTSPRKAEAFQLAKQQFADDFEGGESMLRLAQRIYNLLDELKETDGTFLLVAHNGIARVVNSYFGNMTNEEFARFGIPNCTVMEFMFPEEASDAGRGG